MKKSFIALVLGALLSIPCVLRAEEVEIQLFEVVQMTPLPGDDPLDDPIQNPSVPTRPTDFRATINGNGFSINKLNGAIQSAQATVVNAATGSIVLNQQFTSSVSSQIAAPGVYVLHIQTANGALTGQFVVY